MSDCALCDEGRVDERAYGHIFFAYGVSDRDLLRTAAPAAQAELAERCAITMDARAVRDHFAHHERRQPAPPGYRKEERTIASARELSAAQLKVVRLVGRLGVVRMSDLRALLYGPRLANDKAARAALSRDLHVLVHRGFIYRAAGPGGRRTGGQTLLFPGRESEALLEHAERISARIVTDARDVDFARQRHLAESHGMIARLAGDLRSHPLDGVRMDLRLTAWLGGKAVALPYSPPASDREYFAAPDGIAAIRFRVEAKGIDCLLPFMYLSDDGGRTRDALGEYILALRHPVMGGGLARRVPALSPLGPDRPAPVLVIAHDPHRALWLDEAISGTAASERAGLHLIVTDQMTIRAGLWPQRAWQEAGAPEPGDLVRQLLRATPPGIIGGATALPGRIE